MKKRFLNFGVWLALLATATSCASQPEPGYPYTSVAQLIVPMASGSGTLVALGRDTALILTCRHVAEKVGNSVVVKFYDGRVYHGKVIAVVPGDGFDTDLAMVEISERPSGVTPVPVLSSADGLNSIKGPVTSIGWRRGELLWQVGEITSLDGSILQSNGFYLGGMSGGACIDSTGRLVAVVVASDMATVGVATTAPSLTNFVEKWRAAKGE